MEDILAITFIFGGGALFLIAISPVGRAIADRIRSGAAAAPSEELRRLRESQTELLDEVETLRVELSEVHERLDFTERLLARQREQGLLPSEGHPEGEPGTGRG